MAVQVANSQLPSHGRYRDSCLSFLHTVAMSDGPIPDHVGWLINISDQTKVWGVVLDMLFCVFADQSAIHAQEVIVLPGCNIRHLLYKSAVNGINITNKHSQTISGLSKYQIIIDEKTDRKHVFGIETKHELDIWYKVLQNASLLDLDLTNEFDKSTENHAINADTEHMPWEEVFKATYAPTTRDYPNRAQKMNIPHGQNDSTVHSDDVHHKLFSSTQSSPHWQAVTDLYSPRQNLTDFKTTLRRDQEREVLKQQPIRAMHFQPKRREEQSAQEHLRKNSSSFGSLESLFRGKRKLRKGSIESRSFSNDDSGNSISDAFIAKENLVCRSVDTTANMSQLNKGTIQGLSRSLDFGHSATNVSGGILRRASDLKHKLFNKKAPKPSVKLRDLNNISLHGFLRYKHHLKWHRLWSIVCQGCFYGFKSQSPEEAAHVSVALANCTVDFVAEKEKKQCSIYIFKLQQVRSKSMYLCVSDYNELLKWLNVIQKESNGVISNANNINMYSQSENDSICSSASSQSWSVFSVPSTSEISGTSRSRSRKKKHASESPRNSSCPPRTSTDTKCSTDAHGLSLTDDTQTYGSASFAVTDPCSGMCNDDAPKYDKALPQVMRNDRGLYLFNTMPRKSWARRHKQDPIYNTDSTRVENKSPLLQNREVCQDSKELRRSQSFSVETHVMMDKDPTSAYTQKESFVYIKKRHKPLVVKDVRAEALRERQTISGFIEKKSDSNHWIKYWFVLHEGTLYCYLTADDSVTADVVNLHGYCVTMLVDKIKGKIFVLQLSHEKFTSIYLSMVSREQMECWYECLVKVSGVIIRTDDQQKYDACEDANDISTELKTKLVKQKLLEEMLRQKRELEKKQAERLQKTHSQGTESPDRSPSSPSSPDISSDERRTSDMTRLQQRRISTLLKLESIQKQLEKPGTVKKGFFGFGKTKKPDEHKNVHLQEQLKELKEQFKKLEVDLNHVGHSKNVESIDVNQNMESIPDNTIPSLVNGAEQTPDSEDDEVKRTGVLKSTVKKLTNKAFYKDKLKKKSPVSSKQMNGSLPNLCEFVNGDARPGGGFDNVDGSCIYSEGVNKLNFSAVDLTRPSGNLKLELNSESNKNNHHSISPTPMQYDNTNNRRGTASSLPSPRREIAPAVLAEIDAFEEMTRQVLESRSMEFQTK